MCARIRSLESLTRLKSVQFTLSHQRYQLLIICIKHVSYVHSTLWYHADWINAWICVCFFSVAICWNNFGIVRSFIFFNIVGKSHFKHLNTLLNYCQFHQFKQFLAFFVERNHHNIDQFNFIDLTEHDTDYDAELRIIMMVLYCWVMPSVWLVAK